MNYATQKDRGIVLTPTCRAGDIAQCYYAPEKAKKELGWEAEYGIEDIYANSRRC